MGFDPTIERAKIEAGSDLSAVETDAARKHLRNLLASKGQLSGCTSYCQRKMQIGYNQAARILECLKAEGFITEPDKTGVRHPGPAWADQED